MKKKNTIKLSVRVDMETYNRLCKVCKENESISEIVREYINIGLGIKTTADDIDKILETLEKQQVKVTFFMVGDWIEKNKESAEKIYKAGHELGNHSYNHPHVNNLNYDKNIEQIRKCSELIKEITGNPSTLYRGPYGEYNDTVLRSCKRIKSYNNTMVNRYTRL